MTVALSTPLTEIWRSAYLTPWSTVYTLGFTADGLCFDVLYTYSMN